MIASSNGSWPWVCEMLYISRIPTASSRSGLVAQSVEQRCSNPKVVGSNPTLVRVFLCPCVGPIPILGLIPDGIIGYKNFTVVLGLIRTCNHYW